MGFLIDLHVHTLHSGDSDAEPEEMVEAAIVRGLDGIAFTEHYSYGASAYADQLRERYAGRIGIYRGVEVSALEGHVLVFGLDTDRLSLGGAPVEELLRAIRAHNAVAIPSHPYRRGSSLESLVMELEGITALEGFNGCNLHSMNTSAIEAAALLGLPFTGGSDAHAPREVGSCYTEFEREVSEDSLIASLHEGRYTGHDIRKISRPCLPVIRP